MNNLFLRRHADDKDAIEICSIYAHNTGGITVWAVVHTDILEFLDLKLEDIENSEQYLSALKESQHD